MDHFSIIAYVSYFHALVIKRSLETWKLKPRVPSGLLNANEMPILNLDLEIS